MAYTDAIVTRVTRDVLRAVTGQIEIWWEQFFRPNLDGLRDEELLWEPVAGCWTIRPSVESGHVDYDFTFPPPLPTPVTTIGWRLCHIGVGCLANRATVLYPEALMAAPIERKVWEGKPLPFPIDAAGVLAFLDQWWATWIRGLRDAGEDRLWEPIGEREWDIPDMQLGHRDPVIGLVLHVHRELMHHGGEVGVLRDLWRNRSTLGAVQPV